MYSNNETLLKEEIEKQMQKVQINAMRECAVAICSVILKKALDTSKSPNKRIKDIIKFCNVSLGNKSDSE